MAERGRPAWHQLPQARWLPAGVLLLCLGLTSLLCAWSLRNQAQAQQASLQRHGEAFAMALSGRIQSYVDTLPGLRVFGVLNTTPSDAEFLRYVEAISLQRRFPGLALTFMADLVPHADLDHYQQQVRSDRSLSPDGHPGFSVRPAGPRPLHMVLRHNHPANAPSFGYDLYDPTQGYRAAVDAAITSGGYVATGPLLLARDRHSPGQPALTSVVIRAAVYRGGLTPATAAQRLHAAQGVVGISFRCSEIVRSVLQPALARRAQLRITDLQAQDSGAPALVFDSRWLDGGGPQPASGRTPLRTSIQVADRSWQIELLPLAGGPLVGPGTLGLLALGLALSASLTLMTHILVRANLRAERRVRHSTAQLQQERDNLARSEVRYRMLFANSIDAVMHTLPGGRVLAANPAACALFGCDEATLQAASPRTWIDLDDPRVLALSQARRSLGIALGQTRLRKADGTVFEAEISTRTYTETGPQRQEVASVIVRDVTERQALERQLREAQKMESIGTLAGGVAHDFNNVLAAILGNVVLARQQLETQHAAQPSLALIHQAATRARGLVQQIMTFSRRGPQQRSVQPLRPLVQEALALLRATLPASVQLEARLVDQPLPALVDPSQVQQLVLNLCTNAWQALPAQQGRVQLSLEHLPADDADGPAWACLRVQDNGHGMDEATRARIFEPFFTTKPVGQGTGLGLAVVHGIVSASGGSIRVDSSPGQGSCFELRLPLVATAGVVAGGDVAIPATTTATRGRGEHLLVVDDDEVVSLTVQALLEHAGYRVTRLAQAAQALDLVRADPSGCDLVISDYNMPGMSGLALAEALQALAPQLPVVIASGHVTDELQLGAQRLGVQAVLLKEHSVERLAGLVQGILGRRVHTGLPV